MLIQQLDELLDTLASGHVPPFLRIRLFAQVFSFINVQLFNQLLLRRESCSLSNAEQVRVSLGGGHGGKLEFVQRILCEAGVGNVEMLEAWVFMV